MPEGAVRTSRGCFEPPPDMTLAFDEYEFLMRRPDSWKWTRLWRRLPISWQMSTVRSAEIAVVCLFFNWREANGSLDYSLASKLHSSQSLPFVASGSSSLGILSEIFFLHKILLNFRLARWQASGRFYLFSDNFIYCASWKYCFVSMDTNVNVATQSFHSKRLKNSGILVSIFGSTANSRF